MPTLTEPFIRLADKGSDEAAWLDARASRVTASEVHEIAAGGRATWKRLLDDKLNGAKFRGNATTERGHVREPFLLDFARTFIDASIEPNDALLGSIENMPIAATPDGLGSNFGVEAKSHGRDWDRDTIPPEHVDQMQLGMAVTGYQRWLYVTEVMGEDGTPTLDDPSYQWVVRDERRIAFLLREAQRFTAWREAGASMTDDLPPEVDDALAMWVDARARKKDAEADEKRAEAVLRAHIAGTEGAEDDGLKVAGRAAQFVYTVTDRDVLDEDAWSTAEPEGFAAWQTAQASINTVAETAARLYKKLARSTRLNITPTKDAA